MTGYPRKNRRAKLVWLILMSACCTQTLADNDSLPDMELLEFLAEWETSDGQWVDPLELDTSIALPAEDSEPKPEVQHD